MPMIAPASVTNKVLLRHPPSVSGALPVRACKHDPTYVDADYGPEEPRVADAREAQPR
jgi:hypothetical protein